MMMKWIILVVIIAGVLGIWTYENGKVSVDTKKAQEAVDKSRDFVKEHVEVK